jgi:hypothetical protein
MVFPEGLIRPDFIDVSLGILDNSPIAILKLERIV